MNLSVLGLSFKTTSIDLRERFSVTESRYHAFNSYLESCKSLKEQLVLSTCNRTEIYFATDNLDVATNAVLEALSHFSEVSIDDFKDKCYQKNDAAASSHLYKVASGVESMVIGETEILGQVKEAYLKAHQGKYTKKILNHLFQKALKVGKQVRTETEIGSGRISIASISVGLAQKIFYELKNKKVLLIGSGVIAKQVLEVLRSYGIKKIIIANRNQERAEALVHDFGGEALPFSEIDSAAPHSDIIISSAGSPKPFIEKLRVEGWMKSHHRKSLFLIDLGLPRNIYSDVNDITDVYLYNLDDLKQIAEQNTKSRETAIHECEILVENATRHFCHWLEDENKKHELKEDREVTTKK